MDKEKRVKITIAISSLIVTFIIGLIGSPLFLKWYNQPIIVVDIREFELPKIYDEVVNKEDLSRIPRISIIEVINLGKSVGGQLSLDFKTNNNTTLQGVSIESRSDVLRYQSSEEKDGSSLIKFDMDYIRPNEKVVIKALTDIKANFFIEQQLVTEGVITTRQKYESTKETTTQVSTIVIMFMLMIPFGILINYIEEKIKKRKKIPL